MVFWEDCKVGRQRERVLSVEIVFLFVLPSPVNVISLTFSPHVSILLHVTVFPPLRISLIVLLQRLQYHVICVPFSNVWSNSMGPSSHSEWWALSSNFSFSNAWIFLLQNPPLRPLNVNFLLFTVPRGGSCFLQLVICYISLVPFWLFCSSISGMLYSKFSVKWMNENFYL